MFLSARQIDKVKIQNVLGVAELLPHLPNQIIVLNKFAILCMVETVGLLLVTPVADGCIIANRRFSQL